MLRSKPMRCWTGRPRWSKCVGADQFAIFRTLNRTGFTQPSVKLELFVLQQGPFSSGAPPPCHSGAVQRPYRTRSRLWGQPPARRGAPRGPCSHTPTVDNGKPPRYPAYRWPSMPSTSPSLLRLSESAMRWPIISLACLSGSAAKCAYLCVVDAWVWPKRAPMTGRLIPFAAPTDAKLCRRSWSRTSSIPACARIRYHALRGDAKWRPLIRPLARGTRTPAGR